MKFGGFSRDRTDDVLVKGQLLYRLSYEPVLDLETGEGFEPPHVSFAN